MEKKIYEKPAIEILNVETNTLMAGSSLSNDGMSIDTGGPIEQGDAGFAASKKHHSLWDWGEDDE